MVRPSHIEFLGTRTGDCGCPEEAYLFDGFDLTVHFEPTGEVDGFLDAADWDGEVTVTAPTADEARSAIFAWAAGLTGTVTQ